MVTVAEVHEGGIVVSGRVREQYWRPLRVSSGRARRTLLYLSENESVSCDDVVLLPDCCQVDILLDDHMT